MVLEVIAPIFFQSMTEHLPYLGGLLVRLTADLGLGSYVRHYWSDFPFVCPAEVEQAKTGQVSFEQLSR